MYIMTHILRTDSRNEQLLVVTNPLGGQCSGRALGQGSGSGSELYCFPLSKLATQFLVTSGQCTVYLCL